MHITLDTTSTRKFNPKNGVHFIPFGLWMNRWCRITSDTLDLPL